MGSTYLIEEYPLVVLPTLACAVGLNEAIVIQQINYWISNPKIGKYYDGLHWVRNSLEEWQEQNFPFWSMSTLKRIMASLDDNKLIHKTVALNDNPYDKTLWYTLNRPTILRIVSEYQLDTIEKVDMALSTSCQNDTIVSVNVVSSYTDNTSDIKDNTPALPNGKTSDSKKETKSKEKDYAARAAAGKLSQADRVVRALAIHLFKAADNPQSITTKEGRIKRLLFGYAAVQWVGLFNYEKANCPDTSLIYDHLINLIPGYVEFCLEGCDEIVVNQDIFGDWWDRYRQSKTNTAPAQEWTYDPERPGVKIRKTS